MSPRKIYLTSLQQYFTGIIRRLFTWAEGFFHFEPNLSPPGDKIAVKIDLENLIIEGIRQLKEWEQLQEEIPSLDMALKFTDRPGTNIRKVNLSVEEWKVVSYVNPKELHPSDCTRHAHERYRDPAGNLWAASGWPG
jgi:hypothetical protein